MGTGIAPFGSRPRHRQVRRQDGWWRWAVRSTTPTTVTNRGLLNLIQRQRRRQQLLADEPIVSGDTNTNKHAGPVPDGDLDLHLHLQHLLRHHQRRLRHRHARRQTTPINSAPDEWTVNVSLSRPSSATTSGWTRTATATRTRARPASPTCKVTLTGTAANGQTVNLTTYTDANGGYLFDGLPARNGTGYTVTVTPPAGLNQTYDENGMGSANNATHRGAGRRRRAPDRRLRLQLGAAPTTPTTRRGRDRRDRRPGVDRCGRRRRAGSWGGRPRRGDGVALLAMPTATASIGAP